MKYIEFCYILGAPNHRGRHSDLVKLQMGYTDLAKCRKGYPCLAGEDPIIIHQHIHTFTHKDRHIRYF